MARTRKISTDDILDAAERVVMRDGAAGLSIDAVAQEAGVSKSRVVYDHKSKSALLEALIDRHMSAEEARIRDAVGSHSEAPHPELFGRISLAEEAPDDIDRAVCFAISAAMSSEESKARKPLAAAEVVVEEIEGNPGYYAAKFYLRPHYQLEGLTVSLRLVSKLPSGKGG